MVHAFMQQPVDITSSRERALHVAEQVFPFVLAVFIATTAFAKVVASIAHSFCIVLFILVVVLRQDHTWVAGARTYYRIILGYCAILVISLLYSGDAAGGAPEVWRQITRLMTPLMIIEMVSQEQDAKRYLYVFIAGGTILAAIGVFEHVFRHIDRPPSMWHPVHGANILMFALTATVVPGSLQRSHRKLLVLALCVTAYAVYLTGTRGVWVAVALVLILVPLLHPGLSIRRKIAVTGVIVLMLVLASRAPIVRERAHEAVSELQAYQQQGQSIPSASFAKRFDMWKAGLLMFKEHPLGGVGTGGWKHSLEEIVRAGLVPASITEYGNPHNIFIEALSSRGIIGFLAVVALIGYPLYLAVAAGSASDAKLYATLLLCASSAFIVSGMTDTLVIIRGVFSSYLILTGLALAMLFRSAPRTPRSGTLG